MRVANRPRIRAGGIVSSTPREALFGQNRVVNIGWHFYPSARTASVLVVVVGLMLSVLQGLVPSIPNRRSRALLGLAWATPNSDLRLRSKEARRTERDGLPARLWQRVLTSTL